MDSSPCKPSSQVESESSTRRKRGRKPAKSEQKNRKRPLYEMIEDLSDPDIDASKINSIKKSKRCREYRLSRKQQELQFRTENAALKEQLLRKEEQERTYQKMIADKDSEIQQKNATIQSQTNTIACKDLEIIQLKEQANSQRDSTVNVQNQLIAIVFPLINELQRNSQPTVATNTMPMPVSVPSDQPAVTMDMGNLHPSPWINGQAEQLRINESDRPPDNVDLELPDQNAVMMDNMDMLDMQAMDQDSLVMQEMQNPVVDPVPDIDLDLLDRLLELE